MNSDPSIGGARKERDCMAGKAKKAALAKVASGANVLQVTQEKDKTRERLLAEVGFSPCGANANTARTYALDYAGELHIAEAIAVMQAKAARVQRVILRPIRARARTGKRTINQTNYWRQSMANGWTAERRARQAAMIRKWKPWEQSTGPRTEAGKGRSSQNAFLHGGYNWEAKECNRRVAQLLKDCKAQLRRCSQPPDYKNRCYGFFAQSKFMLRCALLNYYAL